MELPTAEWSAYRARLRDEQAARWLPGKMYLAIVAIADLNCAGDWEPTIAKIAVYAGCSERTVQRAKREAKARGLLAVQSQFRDGVQVADHYDLVLPPTPVTLKPAKPKGCQIGAPSRKKEESKRLPKGEKAFLAGATLAEIAIRREKALGLR